MASLTENAKIETFDSTKRTKHTDRAAAGEYYIGSVVMEGGDDGLVKPVSGTVVAGTTVVGVVVDHQDLDNDGKALDYQSGHFIFDSNGFGPGDRNAVAYFEDDTVAYKAQSDSRIFGGRFRGMVSGSNVGDCVIEVGTVPSGASF